jgi:hypothetical protein
MKLSYLDFETDAVVKSFNGDYTFESASEVADFLDEYYEIGFTGLGCFILTNDEGVEYSSIVANDGSTIWRPRL